MSELLTPCDGLWLPPEGLLQRTDKLDEFVVIARTLVTQQKTPLIIEPFQELCFADHFAGTQVVTIIQPKKLGKSTSVAAIAIYHALTVDDCDVIIVAVSKDQAKIIFRHVRGFIRRSKGNPDLDLNDHLVVKDGFNEIRCLRDLGRIRVLAADDATLEGVEPTLGLVDEYGQHKTSGAYDPLNDGLDTRDGQLLVISNAGADEEGPLGLVRTRMRKHVVHEEGAYTYCRTPEGSEALHEFALKPEQDFEDVEVVKTANPASWMTLDKLARRKASRSTISRWKRYGCGIWVRGDEAAIQPEEWDGLEGPERIPTGAGVIVAVDLAFSGGRGKSPTDVTAIVAHHWTREGLRLIGDPIILEPPSGDGRLDDRAVEEALEVIGGYRVFNRAAFELDLSEDNDPEDVEAWADAIEASGVYTVNGWVYDPNAGAEQLIGAFERRHRDARLIAFEQRASNLARADARFMEALRQKQLRHTGHRGLRQHALDAVERTVGEAFYFDHPKRPRKPQDSLRAASMAHDAAVAEGGTGKAKRGGSIHFV